MPGTQHATARVIDQPDDSAQALSCTWCPNPATHWETLVFGTGGHGPVNFRCDDHARQDLVPNTVSGNIGGLPADHVPAPGEQMWSGPGGTCPCGL